VRRMLGIAAVGMLLLAACGGGGGSNNATCAPNGAQLDITAKSGAYDKACLAAPANQPFTITFHNDEAGAPHNVDILTSANGSSLFKGNIVTGVTTETYKVPALKPGTYVFRCDVHPETMKGTFIVK